MPTPNHLFRGCDRFQPPRECAPLSPRAAQKLDDYESDDMLVADGDVHDVTADRILEALIRSDPRPTEGGAS